MAEKYTEACKAYRSRHSQLDQKRTTWIPHWVDLRDHVLPFHARSLTDEDGAQQNDGSKKHSKIINGVATYAANVLAAGMQSGLTSPARPWFRLSLQDRDMADFGPVKEWLHQVEEHMRYILAMSNLYNGLHHTYLELGTFGTGAMAVLEDYATAVRGRPFTAGEFWIGTDEKQQVNTFYRLTFMTALQMVSAFGIDKVSQSVKDSYSKNSTEQTFGVYHVVEMNDDRIDLSEAQKMPWRSVYMEKSNPDNTFLGVSGFEEFPFLSPRWHVAGNDVYGNGPGMNVLGDIKMLQKMETKGLMALDKQVEPPVVAPGSMENDEIHTVPGGVSYEGTVVGNQGLRPLYQVNANLQHLEAKITKVEGNIKTGYYNDLFLMLAQMPTHQMTATEVAERHEEKLIMLGPVLERLHFELLDPLIDRVFAVMGRNELLPPAPEEIQGTDIKVEYISLLAQAQKAVGLTGVEKFAGFVGNLAAVKPEVLDKFDADEAVDIYAEGMGVPPSIVVPDKEVKGIRAARAEKTQQAEQMAMMSEGAEMLSKAGGADGARTLMDSLQGAPGGGQQ